MNCTGVDRLLISGPLSAEADKHVQTCDRCRALVHALDAPVLCEAPSPETIHRIEQKLHLNLQSVRPLPSTRYFVLCFAMLFVASVSLLTYLWGAAAIPVMSSLQITAIFAALAIGAGLLASSLAHQMLPASRHTISPNLLPVLVVLATAAAIAIFFSFEDEHDFWSHAWTCLRAGTFAGLIVALPFWLVLRRGAILSPALTGATTGLFAGLVGTAALDMHCPNLHALHILAGHLGTAMVCSLAGLIVGTVAEGRSYIVRQG
jgi:hypothetical protein